MTPRQCPFCKSHRAGVFLANWQKASRADMAFVECTDCHAQGPTGENDQEAVEKWNSRQTKRDKQPKKVEYTGAPRTGFDLGPNWWVPK